MMSRQPLLLCRPTGGLTDMLAQIGTCIEYANHEQRKLIVDCNIADFFAEDLSIFFFPARQLDAHLRLRPSQLSWLNQLSCIPEEIAGRIDSYTAEQIPLDLQRTASSRLGHFINLRDSSSKAVLSFDFRQSYDSELVVHHCSGGGATQALSALKQLWPKPQLRRTLLRHFARLPDDYEALHIRHTDLRSNLSSTFKRLNHCTARPLVVATDSHLAMKQAQASIDKRPLLVSVQPLDPADYGRDTHASTHRWATNLPRHRVNEAALVDLVTLAQAQSSSSAELLPGQCKTASGYFELAQALSLDTVLLQRLTC